MIGTLHIWAEHGEVYIVGDRAGLTALLAVVGNATATAHNSCTSQAVASTEVMQADGEGYRIIVALRRDMSGERPAYHGDGYYADGRLPWEHADVAAEVRRPYETDYPDPTEK